MSFEKKFVDIVLFVTVAVLIIAGMIAFAINFSKVNDDSAVLVVETLNPIKAVPKARLAPAKNKTAPKADISNSILSKRAKKPVVITI